MAFTKQEYYETGTTTSTGGYSTTHFGGQTFHPEVSHTVTRVGVYGWKQNSPSGDGYIDLYNCDQDTHLLTGGRLARATYATADVTGTTETPEWIEEDLDSAITLTVDTEYAIVFSQPSSDSSNNILFKSDTPSPTYTRGVMLFSPTGIANLAVFADYDYQFREYSGSGLSTVTTQAVTAKVTTTATGNGNVTDLGGADVTQHGHCWNTTGSPTTSSDKTTNGTKAATGAFTSAITGLTEGTKYFVKAYATNSYGTSYGAQVQFYAGDVAIYPSDAVARVSSIRHIYQPGFFRMQVGLGDLGFDIDVAEATVRKVLDTAKEVVEAPPEPAVTKPPVTPTTTPAPTPPPPEAPSPKPPIYQPPVVTPPVASAKVTEVKPFLPMSPEAKEIWEEMLSVERVACPYCGKRVPSTTLSTHIRIVHPDEMAVGW